MWDQKFVLFVANDCGLWHFFNGPNADAEGFHFCSIRFIYPWLLKLGANKTKEEEKEALSDETFSILTDSNLLLFQGTQIGKDQK